MTDETAPNLPELEEPSDLPWVDDSDPGAALAQVESDEPMSRGLFGSKRPLISARPAEFESGELIAFEGGKRDPVKLIWDFPKPPRAPQTTALNWLETQEHDQESCSICAPTGSGKSAIARSLSRTHTGITLVPQKILQDQYMKTWPDSCLLKGSSNYSCKGAVNCKVGAKHSKVADCRKCSCPFSEAKRRFLGGRDSITNYAAFFSFRQHDPGFNPTHHALIMDEAHNLEQALVNSATLNMSEEKFVKVTKADFKMPRTLQAAMAMMRLFASSFRKEKVTPSQFWTEVEEMVDLIDFVFERVEEEGDDSWILCTDKEGFRVCPVTSDSLYERYVGSRWTVLMSATPPPQEQLNSWLGEGHRSLELPSTFPVANRPVRFVPVGRLNKESLATPDMQNKLLKRVAAILNNHQHEKGIIHTATYALAEMIGSRLKSPRLLIQQPGNREEILETHLMSKKPTVLVSPSMTEGVDLYDDLGRFNIVVKVPFANLGDNWVRARKDRSQSWYSWTAMKDLVQAIGRTTRHEEDYSTSYILDGSFEMLFNRSSHLFPKWFGESVGN